MAGAVRWRIHEKCSCVDYLSTNLIAPGCSAEHATTSVHAYKKHLFIMCWWACGDRIRTVLIYPIGENRRPSDSAKQCAAMTAIFKRRCERSASV